MIVSERTEILLRVMEVIEKHGFAVLQNWGYARPNYFNVALISQEPIGSAEFLDLRQKLEEEFGLQLDTEDLPERLRLNADGETVCIEPVSLGSLTLGEIADVIKNARERHRNKSI